MIFCDLLLWCNIRPWFIQVVPILRVCACYVASVVQLFVTLWTISQQAPLSMGFSRQEYWSELPCPPPGDLAHAGISLVFLMSPALVGRFFTTSVTWEAHLVFLFNIVWYSTVYKYYSLFIHSSNRYLSCVLPFIFEHSCSCFQRPR